MVYLSERELNSEFTKRAKLAGLQVDCIGSGRTDAEVVIVGESVGDKETAMKMPFVGYSGQILWKALNQADIHRKDCYCTNVVKRQTGYSTRTDDRISVPKQELEHWKALLDWELDSLSNVKYVLILGNAALRALTKETGITNWRGSVFDCTIGRDERTVKVICTFNPAHIGRPDGRRWEPFFNLDIGKLKMVLDGDWNEYEINHLINPSPKDAIRFIDKLDDEALPIAYDIETMANETACIGFANDPHEGMCINFRDATSNRYSFQEERDVRTRIQKLVGNSSRRLVAQNGNFDNYWLWYKDRIQVHKVWFDTLLAHHTLYPRMLHNLGFLTSQYTTHPYYKDDGKTWKEGGDINVWYRYNVKDCCITLKAQQLMLRELKQQGLSDFFFNHVMRLQPHLTAATVCGVKVDEKLKDNVAIELEKDIENRREDLISIIRDCTNDTEYKINPNSNTQLRKLFFVDLNLIGRGTSTDKANRERIRNNPKTPERCVEMLGILDRYKEEHKYFSTYATSRVDEDGRFRPEWKQYGTRRAPGRLSSSGNLWGTAQNMQNQPKKAYQMYIADPGYMFSYFDLSQAEARIVAYLWDVQGLIENFELAATKGLDVHRANASRIFNKPYEEITVDDRDEEGRPTERFLGKKCVHGLNYRMMPLRLAEECGISLAQAYAAWNAYHRAFPEIRQAWEDTINEVRKDRELWTPMGRRLIFMEQLDEHSMDSVIAFKPQSTIGDKVSSVIYKSHEDERWPVHARILINIHDALIAVHLPEETSIVQEILRTYAEEPITIRGQPIVIPAEIKQSTAGSDGIHRWSTIGLSESIELGGIEE